MTVGVGFDLGYNTDEQIEAAWGEVLPAKTVRLLKKVSGIKGSRAKQAAQSIQNEVKILWDLAIQVFEQSTLPRFAKNTLRVFEGAEKLDPTIQGVLLSLVFNRGSSVKGDRRREMRNIQYAVEWGDVEDIPKEIRAMKRLWVGKGLDGLLARREAEAKLVESVL